jgi:hypothetical protein
VDEAPCHFSTFHFVIPRVGLVCHVIDFISNNYMREGGR